MNTTITAHNYEDSAGAKNSMPVRNVVMGLGQTGLSCARFLSAQGESVTVVDSRSRPPAIAAAVREVPKAKLSVGRFDTDLLDNADRVIVSPGIALDEPFVREARRRDIPVYGDIELFARAATSPVIAITGSNGKSTVVTMVHDALREAGHSALAGGNLGPPALDLLREDSADFYVLELSSFQLERTHTLSPAVAVVLNVSPDHLDRYNDVADYARTKFLVYRNATIAVVNRDDAAVKAMKPNVVKMISFGLDAPGDGDFGVIADPDDSVDLSLAHGTRHLMAVGELNVPGRHNVANALATLAICNAVGVSIERVIAALKSFTGLPHRTQQISELDGIKFVNDSKATNVGAASAAIRGLEGPLVLIAGGDGKGADFSALAQALAGKARAAVLIGRDAPVMQSVLESVCETRRASSMADAVAIARELAQPGDMVLLSPACASQDMFEDFAARGAAFVQAVTGDKA